MNTNMVAPAAATTCGVVQLTEAATPGWPLFTALVVVSLTILIVRARLEIRKQDRFAALTTSQSRDFVKLERAKNPGGTS